MDAVVLVSALAVGVDVRAVAVDVARDLHDGHARRGEGAVMHHHMSGHEHRGLRQQQHEKQQDRKQQRELDRRRAAGVAMDRADGVPRMEYSRRVGTAHPATALPVRCGAYVRGAIDVRCIDGFRASPPVRVGGAHPTGCRAAWRCVQTAEHHRQRDGGGGAEQHDRRGALHTGVMDDLRPEVAGRGGREDVPTGRHGLLIPPV